MASSSDEVKRNSATHLAFSRPCNSNMPDAALALYIYDSSVMAYSVTIQGSRIALRSRSRCPLLETLCF